jgi:Meckel syndrome type 1 protein
VTAAVAFHLRPRRNSPPDPRLLQRCLVLAALLHVWLVLVFGNATGTAAPGQGVWGSLTVKLLGKSGGEPGAPPGEPAPERRDNGAPGSHAQQRQGGQARPAEPPPTAETGAAELGRWNPREVPPEAARTEEVSPAPPSTATLQLPEGFRPVEREQFAPPARPAPPLPAPELPSTAVGRLETRPDAALTPLAPAASLRAPARPAELAALPAELPAPVNRLDAAPALPATALPRPAELRAAPAAVAQPESDAALPAPVQRLEAPATEGTAVTPLARPSELRTPGPDAAARTALPSTQDLPAPVRRLESADGASSVAPLQAAPSPRAAPAAPGASALPELSGALPGQVSAPAGPARGDPNANPYAAPKASAGSPEAGSRLGQDLAVPPSAAASAPRAPLNLSLPRSGDIASRRGPGLVDLLPQPPERKSKLEQSIEDAANKDCRKAYANTGILAVVPLAVDAVRGKGCKW